MSNPYPYACSRLCNHPVDSEARREYREAVRKAGRDAALGSEDVGFLVSGEVEPVSSCLANSGGATTGAMKRAILEVIVSGAATTKEEVTR